MNQQKRTVTNEYWLKKLSGGLPNVSLPSYENVESATAAEGEGKKEKLEVPVPDTVSAQLKKIGKGSDTAVFILFMAALNTAIYKYTGIKDLTIGTVAPEKNRPDNQLLFCRIPVQGDLCFKEVANRTKKALLEAFNYREYSFDEFYTQLKNKYGRLIPDIFGTAFIYDKIQNKIDALDRFRMVLVLSETGGQMNLSAEFHPSCHRNIVLPFCQNLLYFLETGFTALDETLDNIDILSPPQKEVLHRLNETGTQYPDRKTIQELFEEQVAKNAREIAVVYEGEESTYGQLNIKANKLARVLTERGTKPDSIVGIMTERSLETIVGILGILKAGGAYLPIDPEFPESRVQKMLNDCRADILLTETDAIKDYSFTDLQGLRFKKASLHTTSRRPQIKDFNGVPCPDRSLVDYEKYHKFIGLATFKNMVTIQATRGCPYNCAYCHKIWPKSHVVRSAENIFAEVKRCYDVGIRRFALADDIFNLDEKNSRRFYQLIIDHGMKLQLFFPNGTRGDLLNESYIDLMMEAGTTSIALALESASPRLQKLIKKNLNLVKFRKNIEYICEKYPHVLLELFTMHGFPTETEEEAMMTLNFIKSLRWVDFPSVNLLKIYPNTDMEQIAMENGISKKDIQRSFNLGYHELPETLPFDKQFSKKYQVDFFEFFLSKERLLNVLPHQMKLMSEDEITQKYDSYLPVKIRSFDELLDFFKISKEDLPVKHCLDEAYMYVPDLNRELKEVFPGNPEPEENPLNILLLDLSQYFSGEVDMLYDVVEPPLGLLYLLSTINKQFGGKVQGKIAKSRIDFDNFSELKALLEDFKPKVIGIRTLTFYKDFLHKTVALIRQWGIDATIMVGGPYGTSGYDTILQDQNIDLAVLGEGEETFGELVRQFINTGGNMPTKEVLKGIKSIAFIPREEKARKHSSRDIIMLDALDDLLAGKSGKNPAPANHSNDLAYVLFTSGSTGTPKGTLVEHRNVVRLVKNTNFVDFAKGGRIMQTGALEFDASTFEIWGALLNGLRLYLIDTDKILTPRELKKAVREYGITTMWMTSPLFNRMSTADIEIFEGLENLLVGGDILSPSHINRLRHRFPRLNVINGYGPTENTTFSATYRINKDYEKSIPLGKPIANSTAYVVDPRGGLLPKGVIGELWVGGDGVTRGYLNKPELTAEKFVETMTDKKFYRTGDRAAWRPDGELAFFGRVDHQVKIRGYRIEPGEIECRLLQHDAVQDAVVVEKDVAEGGKNLVAYFVPVPGEGSPASSELRTFLLQELPDFMVPAHFVSLETLPLTPNGKIDRKALPQPLVRVTDHFVAPGDDVERKMVAVWADVLGVNKDTISIDADFFEMGGHSLNATVLAAEIHKTFDVSLPIAVLFKYSRVKELSERVKGMTRDNFISIPLAEKKKSYCLSSAQKRLYILHRMAPDSIAYNIPNVVRLEAEIDLEKLRDTFKELTRRHESLRTAFKMVDETPQQEVLETVELVMENIAGEGTSLSADEAGKAIRDFVRPFDLQRPPLMRLGIVKGVSASLLLVIDMHHIITDGVSHDILVRESRALYDGEELPPLHLQYKDYAEWRNLDVEKNNAKEQERYWKNVFAGEVPVLELPTDYIRPPIRSVEGACEIFVLDEEDTPGLENIAAKTEASLFMVLLSVFYVLLGKLSGAEDIVVGSPVAGRRHADLRPIVGMFVNTLALRNAPTDDIPFDYFLDRLKNNTLEAFDNQEFPFEELVEQVFFTRDLSRNPLFDVMFTLRSEEGIGKDMEGHPDADDYNDLYRISKFDLLLTAVTAGERLEFQLQYCTRLFTRETIRGFVRFFKTIVAAVIKKPGTRIADIPLINDEEKIRLLHSFNSSDTGYRLEKNLFREFADQVKRKPHQMAVVYEECELSYLQLYKQACRLGVMLRHKGGEPGSVVGIMAHRATETIAGIMGILAGGCAYLPIDPQFPTNRKRYMMADSNADLLLDCRVHNHDRPAADAWSENRVLFIDDIAVESRDWEDISQAADYPAYVLYTSGSSGKPKGVLVEHRSVLNLVEELKKRIYRFQSPVHTALISPFVFDASIKQVFPSLLLGHTLVIVPEAARFDGEALIRCYKEKDVRVCDGTPAHMSIMLNYPHLLGAGFPVEQFVVGGEELAYNLCRSFMNTVARKDFKIVNVYGPTECCDVSTSHIVTAESLRDGRPIPVGTPLGNVRCLIMGRNGDVQPAGIPGELCISGAGVARGYLNQPELTAEKFVLGETNGTGRGILTPPTFYRTGDLARQLPDGNFEFLRRLDRQVKIRGFRIELGEIRNRLTSMDIIKDAVVIDAKREGKSGEKFLCAYVIPAAGQEIDVNKIKELLARELPRYMIPAAFVLLQELPLTDVGKIDRRALPTPQIEGTNRYTPPENDTEEILAEIWSDVLEIKKEKISTDADFFELGGHSLKATIIIAKIHKKLDIKVPLAEVFNAPTIRRLALYLQAAKRDSFVHIGTAHIDHHYPLSSAQKGLFFQQLLNPLSTAYNMPQTMRLSGDVDNERLETVFKKLIRRHESFRSSFHIIEEMPAQIVHPEVAFAIKIFNVGHEGEAREIVDGFVKPFNLEHAPLLRVGVIEVKSGDGCIVMVDSHHIITDGVSQAILETEFDHLFRGGELPPLRIQYKDYAVWQNSCIMRDTKKLQGAFWKKEFDGEVPQLTLPADYQRPAVKSLAGAHLNYRVEREMTSLLKQLARETGTTLFMVLLSSYYILLARYSRQEDIVVGSPITGRRHADLQNIIGMFINMMAIRNRPRATMTFASFLAEVKEKVLKSMENQDYHFEELVSELKVKVNPGRNPLFDAIFSMQNIEFQNPGNIDTNAATDSMKVASYGFESGVSRFDLTVNAIEADGTVQLAVEFSTELFQKSTIECMMAHYLEILEQVVREREIKLEDIVLSHQLVAAGSDILREEEGDFEL